MINHDIISSLGRAKQPKSKKKTANAKLIIDAKSKETTEPQKNFRIQINKFSFFSSSSSFSLFSFASSYQKIKKHTRLHS